MLLFIRWVFVSDYQEYWRENILFTFAKGLLAELGVEYGRNIWEWIVEFNFRKSFGKCIKLNSCPPPSSQASSVTQSGQFDQFPVFCLESQVASATISNPLLTGGSIALHFPPPWFNQPFSSRYLAILSLPQSRLLCSSITFLLNCCQCLKSVYRQNPGGKKRPLRIWLLGSLFETLSFGGESVTLWALPELKGDWKVWSSSRWRRGWCSIVIDCQRLGGQPMPLARKGCLQRIISCGGLL